MERLREEEKGGAVKREKMANSASWFVLFLNILQF